MPSALITGASTGIGRAITMRLARSGWAVLAGVREPAAGEELAAAVPDGGVVPVMLDVTDGEQIAAAARTLDERASDAGASGGGRLDALVNNAGDGFGGPLELVSLEDLRRLFEVNTFGQVAVTQAMLPALRRARGRIVFMSSIGGLVTTPFNAPYSASKHALEAIGDALRGELRSSGVRVALVEPGSVATPLWGKAKAQAERTRIPPELDGEYGNVPSAMAKFIEDTARRGIPPEEVASVVERALTSRRMKSRYVVGRDARGILLMSRLLPDLLFDRVILRAAGL